jgi:hypothetical protein
VQLNAIGGQHNRRDVMKVMNITTNHHRSHTTQRYAVLLSQGAKRFVVKLSNWYRRLYDKKFFFFFV